MGTCLLPSIDWRLGTGAGLAGAVAAGREVVVLVASEEATVDLVKGYSSDSRIGGTEESPSVCPVGSV